MYPTVAMFLISTAFVLTWVLTRAVEAWAPSAGLIKAPNERSSHTAPTPRGGGVAIAIVGGLVSIALATVSNAWIFFPFAALGGAIAVLGFVDDLWDLSPAIRFPVQAAVVGLLIWLAWAPPPLGLPFNLVLDGGWLALLLILAGLWWVNLFNFMDGIDGIAASQAILILLLAELLWWLTDPAAALAPLFWLMACTAAATSGFLVRNWPPARIFMGDAGSNFLALLIFGFALLTTASGALGYSVWLILVSPFVSDATVTLLRRIWRGERPWQAHRRHAYQQLSRLRGHKFTTLAYCGVTLLWAGPLALGAQSHPTLEWTWVAACYIPQLLAVAAAGGGAVQER